ncbi:universal stress protein [Streptomyces sp. Da 82-17]|uniref:universal stress protein n=1 Tax=Streptomyces sp. Da 82-17 TaxID=3377116 RepID=UPI0038D377B2
MTAQVTVGVDGSQESLAAARWAAREAVLREVPLRLVHVEEWPTAAEPAVGPRDRTGAEGTAALLHDTAEQARSEHPGLEVFTGQALGRAGAELTAVANESDLTVLGSRGLGGIRGYLLGSVSLQVAGAAQRPVALVRGDGSTPGTGGAGILVGVDLAHSCDALLAFAFAEASRSGQPLRFLNCWTPPPSYGQAAWINPGLVEDMGEHRIKGLGDLLEPWQRRYPGVEAKAEAILGGSGVQLVEAAGEAELVVVGRRSRHTALGPHLGHAAHAVIHHSPAPVVVVPCR